MKAVILANEIGEKLWPLTSSTNPKALLPLYNTHSMLEETIARTLPLCANEGKDLYIASTKEACKRIKGLKIASGFGIPVANIISIPEEEQSVENKFRLIATLLSHLKPDTDGREIIAFIPADQFFWPEEGFIFHMQNLISGLVANPEQVGILTMQPGTPAINMNYLSVDHKSETTIGATYPINQGKDLLGTSFLYPTEYRAAADTEAADALINEGWLWDLNTTVSSIGFLKKCIKEEKDKTLSSMFSTLINNKKLRAAVATKVVWSMLDNWASIRYLTYEANLFSPQEDKNIHSIESAGNLVKKKAEKEVILMGVQNLIIIDTDDKLLVATPEALYEHF